MLLKPAPGAAAAIIATRRRRIKLAERLAKNLAKERDHCCCRRCGAFAAGEFLHAAHIDDKGMGGDHGLRSSLPSDYVSLCVDCHTGPRSVHSGHVKIVCLSPRRGDGPVRFDPPSESARQNF